jgi:mannose-6-phosphate isomerase-like protein (cupin superfamily)
MKRESTYESWIQGEGIPIVEGFGVEDVKGVTKASWHRTGGKGAFLQLKGLEGFTGIYVGEIPSGGTLNPEKHLYEEMIYILQGMGAAEVWSNPAGKLQFEFQPGSLFAVPLNSWHRLVNGSKEPVIYLAVTSAPLIMDLLHDPEFVFGCDYIFNQRFDGRPDYFTPTNKRGESLKGFWVWESNFMADIISAPLDSAERKGAGVRITAVEMSGSTLVGHIAEWPIGRYHKAHHHQGGAVLLILRSEGYTLMWPQEAGIRPYENGKGDQVVKVDWKVGSVFSPPTGWFHQHFNTGAEKARQLAFRYSGHSGKYLLGIVKALNKEGVRTSTRDGGTLIEYEDEDPQIRRDYEAAVTRHGRMMQMPNEVYQGA